MHTFAILLVLLVILGASAYFRLRAVIWGGLILLVLLAASFTQAASPLLLWPAWLIFLLVATFTFLTPLRRSLITGQLIHTFRKVLPPMSSTEREALEAGEVWWEGALFQGRPDWSAMLAYPKAKLTKEESDFLDNQVDTLCSMLNAWEIEYTGDLPKAVWDYLKKEKFFAMLIPKQYGGLEFSAYAQSTVVTKIATRSVTAGVTTMVPNSLGPGELLIHYGTEAQKDYYLLALARGDEIPCFALTGLPAGSDAAAMRDVGIVCRGNFEGREILGMRLTWSKRYITLAPIATVLGLAFKLQDPDHLLGDQEDLGITCALIPTSHPGVKIGRRHFPMHLSFLNGPTEGTDVFVPLDWIIGGPDNIGKGWRMLMNCLSVGRAISLPAISTAGGKKAYRMTGAYAKLREQFKVSIGQFEGVQEAMARIGGYTYLLEATRLMTASALSQGAKPALVSAIAKYHMTEMCRHVINDAMDIHGGRAVQAGPRNYLLDSYLSIPVGITVEGANILTRSLMIFGQGAVRCHPYIFQEMEALSLADQKQGLIKFDGLLIKHFGYGLSNLLRSVVLGLTGARLVRTPGSGSIARYYQAMTRFSSALALVSDLAMLVLGGDLKRRESLSARLGDVLSYLYLASSALKYYEDHQRQKEDLPYLHWTVQFCLYQIQEAFRGFLANFPVKWLAQTLSCVIFPWGYRFSKPRDMLGQKIAASMMEASPFRQRLTQYAYVGKTEDDITGRVELAFQKMSLLEPILKKIHQASKEGKVNRKGSLLEQAKQAFDLHVITKEQWEALQALDHLRDEALKVDDFAFEALIRNCHTTRETT